MTVKAIAKGIAVSVTSMALSTTIGLAVTGGITSTPGTAQAEAAQTSDPPCGYDVYKGKVYITSLGKAKGTARVIKWTKSYRLDGKARGVGTLVDTKRIKRGQTVTVKRPKHTKANRITVDIVKGKLTKNEGRAKVWHCEPA